MFEIFRPRTRNFDEISRVKLELFAFKWLWDYKFLDTIPATEYFQSDPTYTSEKSLDTQNYLNTEISWYNSLSEDTGSIVINTNWILILI